MGRRRRKKSVALKPDTITEKCGVVYAATGGERNIMECIFSAESIKELHGDLNITLFTDSRNKPKAERSKAFDNIVEVKNPNRRNKLDAILNSPYERTLYLDNDTQLMKAVLYEVFRTLDRFDISLTHAPLCRVGTKIKEIPASFPEFNGGVIFFKNNDKVMKIMQRWYDDYHARNIKTRYGHRDQPYLRRALWESDLRIATLLPDYNARRKASLKTCIRHRHKLYKQKP